MRPKRIILLFVIACVGGVIFFFVCKYTYDFKVVKLKEKARNAFIGAVDQELRNRSVDGDCSFNLDAKAAMSAEIPDSVYNHKIHVGTNGVILQIWFLLLI